MLNLYRLVAFVIIYLFPQCCFSYVIHNHDKIWFYPWINEIKGLEVDSQPVPLLLGGCNYRILKISSFQGNKIEEIVTSGKKVSIEFFYLPVMKSYDDRQILDLVLPIDKKMTFRENDIYILLKFYGISQGQETINISIKSDKRKYFFSKNVSIAGTRYTSNINLNVWAYFDYNYLVKGVRSQVMKDLINHNVNSLVIPPYVLPAVTDIQKNKLNQLGIYIRGLNSKFKNYIVYFGGFQDRKDNIMETSWKRNYALWLKAISKVFNDNNIPFDKVILYPYDEPKGNSIYKLEALINYTKLLGIKNRFFVTLSNIGSEQLADKVDIVQVHSDVPGLLEKVLITRSKLTDVWIYETKFGLSKNVSPKKYLGMSYKASKYNATGIGIWCYADVKRENLGEFHSGLGTWEFKTRRSPEDYDYSLVYRRDNLIYPSIRWEALSFGIEEIFWLKLYENKFGRADKQKMLNSMLNNGVNTAKWESIKLILSK